RLPTCSGSTTILRQCASCRTQRRSRPSVPTRVTRPVGSLLTVPGHGRQSSASNASVGAGYEGSSNRRWDQDLERRGWLWRPRVCRLRCPRVRRMVAQRDRRRWVGGVGVPEGGGGGRFTTSCALLS